MLPRIPAAWLPAGFCPSGLPNGLSHKGFPPPERHAFIHRHTDSGVTQKPAPPFSGSYPGRQRPGRPAYESPRLRNGKVYKRPLCHTGTITCQNSFRAMKKTSILEPFRVSGKEVSSGNSNSNPFNIGMQLSFSMDTYTGKRKYLREYEQILELFRISWLNTVKSIYLNAVCLPSMCICSCPFLKNVMYLQRSCT